MTRMHSDALRKLLEVRQFEPVEVELLSVQVFTIKNRENAMVLKNTLVSFPLLSPSQKGTC